MARIVQLSSQTEPPFLRAEDLTMYLLESVISTKAEIAALRALMADYGGFCISPRKGIFQGIREID